MLNLLRSVSLPSLSGAVVAARSAVGQGAQAVTSLGASVSTFATDTLARVERPSLTWLPDLPSLSVPTWLVRSGVAPDRLALALSPAGISAAPTIEGWESSVGNTGIALGHFFPKEGLDWSQQIDLDGLSRFLREQYPDKTAQNVAARTKLPADTVKKWLLGVALPNGRAMLVLACAFGPEVLVAMLRHPPGWLDEAARGAEQARLQAQLADLQAQIGRVA
ncbi:hypothetical protein [Methylobacterium sp.]|uniref:hypothetical protein n=1 Tax=Methylobacterium sp. TaxID=409 RepID=UPI0025CEC508|nr:hypothetical protein [Methylobacterium sp.]MBY0259577.1 hypothetical protein [Methylobacterium sp.]